MNDDICYCMRDDCPHEDCERHPRRLDGRPGIYTTSDLSAECDVYYDGGEEAVA